MNKDSLEFYRVLLEVQKFCGFELSKTHLTNTKVEFRYLKVKNLLAQTSEFIDFLRTGESLHFHDFIDAQTIYQRLASSLVLTGHEIRQIYTNILVAYQIKNKLANTNYEHLKEFSETLLDGEELLKYVDIYLDSYGEIKESSAPELANVRKSLRQTQAELDSKLKKFINDNKDIMMEDLIVSRNNRNCVLVIASQKNKKQGLIHAETSTGLAVYFEPQDVINLNNQLTLLYQKEEEIIFKLLKTISEHLKNYANALMNDFKTIQQLDIISAKAKYSISIDGVIPVINREDKYLYLKNAGNPLIDHKLVVKNTYELKTKYNTIIISGSNTGGKTVTLKTIGLFIMMAMSGLAISCDEAIIPMYDQLLFDIGDEQSIEQSLSTFSSHIRKMAEFTQKVTPNTMILLDELGSGSDPKDSQNLAMAFLDYFRMQKATIIVTTHFEKIKEYGKIHDDILVASVGFDFNNLKPTYQYLEHQSGNSNALLIAERLGVNEQILQLAKTYEKNTNDEQLVQSIDKEFAILKTKNEQLDAEKQQLEQAKKQFLLEQQHQQRQLIKQLKVQEQAFNEKIQLLEQEANSYLEQLKQQNTHQQAVKQVEKIKQLKIEEPKPTAPQIVVNDYVEIIKMHYFGYVEKIQGNKCIVNCNGVKINTTLKDLQLAPKPKVKVTKSHHVSKVTQSSSEINVIGMTVAEAWSVIDPLLDAAILANRATFLIIHGVGSGKLRAGIHQKLQKYKGIKGYNLTNNLGATEVLIK